MTYQLQWQFRVNQLVAGIPTAATFPPAYTADNLSKAQLWHIKESFKGDGTWTDENGVVTTSTNNWIVRGSSNSVAAGNNDGVDRWVTDQNIVSGAGVNPKSWIVLAQPQIAANFEICISMSSGQYYNPLILMSPTRRFGAVGGGADGTATARPTALDEIVVSNSANCGVMTAIGGACRIHFIKSADGTATRLWITRGTNISGFWLFDKPGSTSPDWTTPAIGFVQGSATTNETSPYVTAQILYRAAGGGNFAGRNQDYPNGAAFVAQAETTSGWLFARESIWVANEYDGAVQFYPNQLVGTGGIPGTRGTYGQIKDMYYAPEGFQPGTVSPDGDWVVAWPMALPWNKSVPLFY